MLQQVPCITVSWDDVFLCDRHHLYRATVWLYLYRRLAREKMSEVGGEHNNQHTERVNHLGCSWERDDGVYDGVHVRRVRQT